MEMELLNTHDGHQSIENQKLPCRQRANHNASWSNAASAKLRETRLFCNVCKAGQHTTISACTLLVDLGEERVCGVPCSGSLFWWASSCRLMSRRTPELQTWPWCKGSA
eukprot:Skav216982  [mRNA]  locus=scaffold594:161190:161562:+ [translate_table: standard]